MTGKEGGRDRWSPGFQSLDHIDRGVMEHARYGFGASRHTRLVYSEILTDQAATPRIPLPIKHIPRSARTAEAPPDQALPASDQRKVERFDRTLATEWAYAASYLDDPTRGSHLPGWLHHYNRHRPHTGIGGLTPAARVHNLMGNYI